MVDELKDYWDCYNLLKYKYEQVNGCDFYRYIFPSNQLKGQTRSTDADAYQSNAIYLYKPVDEELDVGRKLKRRLMLNDTWDNDYAEFIEKNDFTLCSGLSYRGKANTLSNAQKLHALIFDLDGVGLPELKTLLLRFGMDATIIRTLPVPTFLVLSGTGVHVYYVLEEPVDLYPNIKFQFKEFKHSLTFRMWEYTQTSKCENIQQQSINQGFRMVGSINNKHNNEIVAFKIGDRVSLDYLNSYLQLEKVRVDITKKYKSKISREQAKKKYPEWYEKVIVNGIKTKGKWTVSDNVYKWWIGKANEIKGGHRYFYLMCLGAFATKCGISKEKLHEDMLKVFETLKKVGHENQLTMEDVESAMKVYKKELFNLTIDDIEKLTGLRIERNKRNGRKQADHLKMARYIRDEINGNKDTWRDKSGRKDKFVEVLKFILMQKKYEFYQMPKEKCKISKYLCIKKTGLSKMTVYNHYDTALKLATDDFDRLRMLDLDDYKKIDKKQLKYIREYVERRYDSEPDSKEKKENIKFDYYHEVFKYLYINGVK